MTSTQLETTLPQEGGEEQELSVEHSYNTARPLTEENLARRTDGAVKAEQKNAEDISELGNSSSIGNLSCSHCVARSNNSEIGTGSRFDCNICLETVDEPVVTRCGHLYCWACLYKWLEPGITPHERSRFHFRNAPVTHTAIEPTESSPGTESRGRRQPSTVNMLIDLTRRCCPVCKAKCTIDTLVPIYVKNTKNTTSNGAIPLRPHPDATSFQIPHTPVETRDGTLASPFEQPIVPILLGLHPSIMRNNSINSHITSESTGSQQEGHYLLRENDANEFLSRLLLILGSFVMLVLLLF